MSMLQQIISQSSEYKDYPIKTVNSVINIYRVGDRRSVFPSVLWQENKTFFGANKTNTSYNNQIQIFQYDHNYGSFVYKDVGNGTDTYDEYNHPLTYLWNEGGTLYCGQTNTHNAPIDIYKSNLLNDIRSGFTKLTSISGENAYPQVFRTISNKTAFCVRQYPEGVGDFNLSVQISDGGIEGTFTKIIITENTVGYRHYNVAPLIYGSPTKHYLISALRNDVGGVYFAQAVYVTEDFETYSNIDGTFSKNIALDGALTMAEIEANYIINGSTANDTVNFEIPSVIQVNNDLFFSSTKEETTDKYLFKITDDGTLTTKEITIPNNVVATRNPILYYNGLNILLSVLCNDAGTQTKEIWSIDIDFMTFTQVYVLSEFNSFSHIFLPDNINEVNGEYAFFADQNNTEQTVTLIITDDKFIL